MYDDDVRLLMNGETAVTLNGGRRALRLRKLHVVRLRYTTVRVDSLGHSIEVKREHAPDD